MQTATNPNTGEKVRWDAAAGQWVPVETTQAPTPEQPQARGTYLDPIMQGLTLGASDELASLGARLGSSLAGAPPERVQAAGERELSESRARLADIRERSPWLSLLNEMTGSLVTGAPVAKGLTAGARAMGMGPVMAPIAAGATEGAGVGAMAADEDRALGAALGGTMGGMIPAAMPLMAGGVRLAAEKGAPYARKIYESAPTTANRIMAERIGAGGETPARLASRARQLGPEATMVDIAGPSGVGLGQGILQADKTGQALADARRQMSRRAAGSTGRLERDITGITGVNERMQASLDALRARQVAAAEPWYAQAYSRDISLTPGLKELLNRPPMKRAFQAAKEAAETRGEELPTAFRLDDVGDWSAEGVMPDMRAWDRMKQGIDDLIDAETDSVTGRLTPRGRDLTIMKRDLLKELDDINPDYKRARQIFAGDAAIESATREGERFLNMKTREVQKLADEMSDSEKQGFLVGALEAIREKMGRARAGEIGEFKFLETGNTRNKLRAIFPEGREGDRQLAELMRTLDRERTFAANQGALIGGSQTAQRLGAGEALESGVAIPTTVEAMARPVSGLTNLALGGASEALGGTSQKAIRELSQLMLDPDSVTRALSEIQKRQVPDIDYVDLMSRYARGGALLSPWAGLAAGGMANQ